MTHYKYDAQVEYEAKAYAGRATEADEHFDVIATSKEEARQKVEDAAEWPILVFHAIYEVRETRPEDFG